MEITQQMVDTGAEAIMNSSVGKSMDLREVEGRVFTEIVLRAVFDARLVVPLILEG